MCRNKIHRQVILRTVIQNFPHPDAVPRQGVNVINKGGFLRGYILGFPVKTAVRHKIAGGRSANPQSCVNTLDGLHTGLVQGKILAAGAVPKSMQVSFIPDLKVPLADFLRAVALQPVAAQCGQ